jgi:23S rRNA pseudouridine2604 synthase
MAERPTIKLKPGAAPRNPQRLRVRATTAPRSKDNPAAAEPRDTPPQRRAPRDADAPRRDARGSDGPRRPPRAADAERREPRRGPAPARPPRPGPAAKPAAPRPERRPLPPARPVTPAAAAPPPAAPVRRAPGDGVRLSKVLTERGIASRREADDWIAAGWVRVDGQMAVLGQRVRPEQRIDIDPAARKEQARSVTILLHKPIGYVSGQAEDGYPPAATLITPEHRWDEEKRPFHPGHARGLAPAGRLDIDSTGLLVLTQDGRVAKLLIGEHSLVEKEYLVRVTHRFADGVPDSAIALLRHGLELDGEALKPAKVSWANEDQLRIVLQQGKKRQIRRMCEAVGLKVTGLKRVRIGSVVLGKLPLGQWRYLRDDERF